MVPDRSSKTFSRYFPSSFDKHGHSKFGLQIDMDFTGFRTWQTVRPNRQILILGRESYNNYKRPSVKYVKWALIFLLIGILAVTVVNYPKLNIISGYAAKNMASTVFIAGRQAISVVNEDHRVPLIELARAEVSPDKEAASARVFGLMERKAVCREGLGCVLLPKGMEEVPGSAPPNRYGGSESLMFPYGDRLPADTVFPEVDYKQLERAMAQAFANNDTQRTRTVLIAYKNRVLAEKYVGGFNKDTPVLGWSMTKSVLATLYGILEYQGKINLGQPAPFPDWKNDVRDGITIDHLLRMQSGLEWEEDYSTISDVTRMLFMEADMAAVQMDKPAVAPPGEIWNYSSGTSNLLSGILRRQFRSEQEYIDFPYKALIDKTGMHSMMLETDVAGNFVGSSYGWASTRDWAKFGLLYLNEGNWNGEQLFDARWVSYVTHPTAHSNGRYGAHFWLNSGGFYPGVPKDLYSANGYQGQYVFIIPSLDMVIVRTGLAEPPDFDLNAFLEAVTAAISPSTSGE